MTCCSSIVLSSPTNWKLRLKMYSPKHSLPPAAAPGADCHPHLLPLPEPQLEGHHHWHQEQAAYHWTPHWSASGLAPCLHRRTPYKVMKKLQILWKIWNKYSRNPYLAGQKYLSSKRDWEENATSAFEFWEKTATLLMSPWPVKMVNSLRLTRSSLSAQVHSSKIYWEGTSILIHWSTWEVWS